MEDILELNVEEKIYLAIQESLYRSFAPYPAQVDLGRAIFEDKCRLIFVQCGRGWGKSLSAAWLAAKYALENPDSVVYILAPLYKQVKEIYWYPRLMQQFIDDDFISRVDKQETYFELRNGSRIKLDGSDNKDSQRGVKPNFVVADEYADFDSGWIDVMLPNVGKVRGQVVFIGTPPEFPKLHDGTDHHYVGLAKQIKRLQKEDKKKGFHIWAPTETNPYYPKDVLEEEEKRLRGQGEDFVWEREYMAKIVSGAKRVIFPQFHEETHVASSHEELMSVISANPSRYEYVVTADPGTKACFAVNFIAVDRYTSTPYFIDEIHEEDPALTTGGVMCPRIREKMHEYWPEEDEWFLVADCAAASFIADAAEHHDLIFVPSRKQPGDKQEWLGVLGDVFNNRVGVFSPRCEMTVNEIMNYVRDDRGMPLKKHDHHIDAIRYGLKAVDFTFNEKEEKRIEVDPIREGVMISLERDLENRRREDDWTIAISDDFDSLFG